MRNRKEFFEKIDNLTPNDPDINIFIRFGYICGEIHKLDEQIERLEIERQRLIGEVKSFYNDLKSNIK